VRDGHELEFRRVLFRSVSLWAAVPHYVALARARRERDIVGDRGPQAHGRDARLIARIVQHADDAGRALVPRTLQPEALDQLGIGRTPGYGRGPRVRHVREQRAERDHQLDAEVARQVDDHAGE